MNMNTQHMIEVAKRKSAIDGWEPYRFEVVGKDAIMFTGSIPRLLKRGPRKGEKTWDGKGTRVVVTDAEGQAEQLRYEESTGNCGNCFGKREVFASWDYKTGTKHKECSACSGTGLKKLRK